MNTLFFYKMQVIKILFINVNFASYLFFAFREMHVTHIDIVQLNTSFEQSSYCLWRPTNKKDFLMWCGLTDNVYGFIYGKSGCQNRKFQQ